MRIFRNVRRLPGTAAGAVAAVGNFDGVHLGHRVVIDGARRLAAAKGAPSAVLTFEPHPRRLFRPEDPPFRLTPFRVKAQILAGLGIDLMLAPRFNRRFAAITAEDFVAGVLAGQFALSRVVCGADFVFGKGRAGDVSLLQRLGPQHGIAVTVIDPVGDEDTVYSSTNIRELLAAGDPRGAARLMGRPFEVVGRVRRGAEIGRKLGFPTANVDHRGYLVPATGVYAVRAAIDVPGQAQARGWIDGVANFGRRPTVDGVKLLLEVHLFDFAGELYGHRLRVRFVEHLRPERRFDGLDALKAQIAEDARQARRILASHAVGHATDRDPLQRITTS
ncbi:MAG: bifunctional riboflavin kinase/FAD synthetase [Alphaproteobacteria bacterium]|nr:bifunctional riboflavin kinase/FAD synthetase [Alphaproteobacteria bacterium]